MGEVMNLEDALRFLREHQPMSDHASTEEVRLLHIVQQYFYYNPHEDAVPLLLNAFGYFSDQSLYEGLVSTLKKHDRQTVLPHVAAACESPHRGVRLAAANVAFSFPHEMMVDALSELLRDEFSMIRLSAANALERIGGEEVQAVVKTALILEKDEDVQQVLESILARD